MNFTGKHNARHIGGDLFIVQAVQEGSNAKAGQGKVTDHMNGTYTVKWTSQLAGVNLISITMGGEQIAGYDNLGFRV